MNSNKILIYVGSEESDQPGAIGTHTAGIVNALCETAYFDKTIFMGGKKHSLENALSPFKTDIHEIIDLTKIPSESLLQRLTMRFAYINAIANKIKIIQAENSNSEVVVYTRYSLALSFLLIKSITKLANVSICTEYNDITRDQLLYIGKIKKWGSIGTWLRTNKVSLYLLDKTEAYVFKHSTLAVAITDGIAEFIKKLAPVTKTVVVPNASSMEIITKTRSSNKQELRKELNLDPHAFYLIHCGTLTLWDGLEDLIHALAHSLYKDQIRLLVIGEGDAKKSLQAQVVSKNLTHIVSFLPSVKHSKAIEYVMAADIIPIIKTITSYQLSPIKYYEALAAGKPLICSDVLYINEIGKFDFGRVVKFPLSEKEIAESIDYFFERKDRLLEWQKEITAYAEANHLWKHRAELILRNL